MWAMTGIAGLDHGPDGLGVELAALDLDRVGQAFLEEPDAGGHGLLGGDLVAAERQVRHHQGAPGRPGHGAAQREEFVHRHGQAGFVAEDVVGGGVADQEHLDAGLVENLRGVLVVGGQHREALAVELGLLQVVDADPATWLGREAAADDGAAPCRARCRKVPGLLRACWIGADCLWPWHERSAAQTVLATRRSPRPVIRVITVAPDGADRRPGCPDRPGVAMLTLCYAGRRLQQSGWNA